MSETSPAGEAGSGTDTTDKEASVECPTCGRTDFASDRGMRWHHAVTHGENISKQTVSCDNCGNELTRLRCNINNRNFCDMACKGEWASDNIFGSNHHQYERVTVECEICDETIDRKPSHVDRSDKDFCSQECHREYQSRHQVGENHHNYNGGRAKEYGPNWHKQRRKAIKRDNGKCKMCGKDREDMSRDIHVHHIIPRKQFMGNDGFDHKRANKLSNLISLCSGCHAKVEGWNLKPDTRE